MPVVFHRSDIPAIELTGTADAPVVVALGGISSHAHVVSHSGATFPGWWEALAGPDRAIDTTRCRLLGYGYPVYSPGPTTTQDQARGLARALDACGIATVHAIVGASYGGMVALAFAELFPERVERIVAISAPHQSHPMATAVRLIQRKIIRLSVVAGRPADGVALARALGITSYRTAQEFAERFSAPAGIDDAAPRFPVEEYLDHCGARFAEGFPADRYLALSESLDLHRVNPEAIPVPVTLVAVTSDTLVPPVQIAELASRLGGPVKAHLIESRYGHDAFLKEVDVIGQVLTAALALEAVHGY